jgi:hypothetical protein
MDTDTDTDDVDTDTAVIKVRWDTTEITSYETTFTAADLADMGITGDGLAAVLSAAERGALTDRLGPGELGDYDNRTNRTNRRMTNERTADMADMDPNATLRLFREHYARYSELFDQAESVEAGGGLSALSDLHEEMADQAEAAADHANDLFLWLANGGFAPDWTVTNV